MSNEPEEKKVIPILPDAWEFVEGKPHLVGTKCDKCGAAYFPPRYVCTNCLTDETVHRAVLGNTGRVYAATTIRVAAKEFNPPYPFGYVVLEPEEIRIPAQFAGIDNADNLIPGTRVEMVIDKLREDEKGNTITTFKFKPVTGKEGK